MDGRGNGVNKDGKRPYKSGKTKTVQEGKRDSGSRKTTLVIEGNAVYELDEECLKWKNRD